jgi:integrase
MTMTGNKIIIATAEDLLRFLEKAEISATRCRDLKSAVNRFCDVVGLTPQALRLEVGVLREMSRKALPAAGRVSWKRWADIRSLFTGALELAGVADRMPRGIALKHPVWGPLIRAIASDKRLAHGLAAFANWCVLHGIAPDHVGDSALQDFHNWLVTRTLCPKPRDVVRRIPHLWNEASDRIEIWPNIKLTPVSFKPRRKHLPWEALNEGFQHDVEAYLNMRAHPDLFDERPNAPRRALAASTLGAQSEHLRLSASVLIQSDVNVDDIKSLADLVQPERVKTVLRHYHTRANGQPNAFVVCLAKTLLQVAYHYLDAAPEELDALKRIASKLPAIPLELTAKNKALLRQFESKELRARLLFLPEQLIAEVVRDFDKNRLDFVKAQVAIAIDFQLAIPLRPQNLSRLSWQRHFSGPDGPKGRLLLHLPGSETKSGDDYNAEVPEEVARRLRWYRRCILPRLGADLNGPLFVTDNGKLKDQRTITVQIIKATERFLGIHMTPHQFRHFCAVSYLEAHPEDFETVRILLGHAWSKTTRIYVGSSGRRAIRAYNDFLFSQRAALKLKRKPRRKPKPRPAKNENDKDDRPWSS